MKTADDYLYAIKNELAKAMTMFREFHSSHEGWALIREEVDELWDEVKKNNLTRSREEALQVAAMALRYLIEINDPKKMSNRVDGLS